MVSGAMEMSRRFFLKSAAAGAGSMFLPGPVLSASSDSLSVGYLPITDAAPLLIAHALGYFAEEGVGVERPVMVRSWQVLAESFLAGKFDLTHMLFPIPVWMRFKQKIPIRVLMWDHTNGSAVTVDGNSDIKGFADLAGKKIAVPSWYSMHNLIMQLGLRAKGLTPVIRSRSGTLGPREVNLFVMSPPEMPTALLGGKIDGFIVAEPFNALARMKLKARIMRFSGDIWKNHPCCVVVTREEFAARNARLVQKAVNAVVRAQIWCADNPGEAAYLLSREGEGYLPMQRNVLREVFSDPDDSMVRHPDWNVRRIGFQPYPYPSATRFIVDRMKETLVEGNTDFLKGLDAEAATAELVDDSFVRRAIRDCGGLERFYKGGVSEGLDREEVVEID
ncbi:MAG: ABC transporter substrate-binding protein [Thermodesulfobacteriota bacterium]